VFSAFFLQRPKTKAVTETVGDFVRYGYVALPLWVFAEQLGVPIPAAPILLVAGAIAGTGRMNLAFLTALALAGALTADLIWYHVGYAHGSRALGRLCRVCLEPDSCVRRVKNLLEKHGLRSLLVAKFVPGLNAMAAPVAGTIRIPWWQFVAVDSMGIIIWVSTFELLGFVLWKQLESLAVYASRMSAFLLAVLVITALTAYLVRKYARRRTFLQDLRMARISPEELKQKLDRHEPVTVIDLRHSLDFLPEPYTIPGAIRIPMEDLDKRNREIPRGQEVVLYCTCPNEASSAVTAVKLRKYGVTRVRPLHGGFHMWRRLGFPLESEFGPVPETTGQPTRCATCEESSTP
jgi:membrane protein DedA with SNARE-associated domain/rhodanese-related sulfurtransferase